MMTRHSLRTIAPVFALFLGCDIGEIDLGSTDSVSDPSGSTNPGATTTKPETSLSGIESGSQTGSDGETDGAEIESGSQTGSDGEADGAETESGTSEDEETGSGVDPLTTVLDPACHAQRLPGAYSHDGTEACLSSYHHDFIEGDYCRACQCLPTCRTDDHCAPPSSGTAQAVCIEGTCAFTCSEDAECPEDSRCIPGPNDEPNRCMVVETGHLECGANPGDPDPCAALDTPAACNAEVSDHSLLRCRWVEERYFGDEDDTSQCGDVTVEGRCLLTRELEDDELETSCGASCESDLATYWRDLGGRTFGIFDLPCELAPYGAANQCGISRDREPLVCGCGGFSECD